MQNSFGIIHLLKKKMRIKFILIAVLFAGVSCKSSKNTANASTGNASSNAQTTNEQKTNKVTLAADEYRFIVSFISFGGGPDFKTVEAFKKYIEEYNEKHKKKAVVETFPWGREGESDYCFKLADLSETEQENFINGAGTILAKSDRVRASQNSKCTHKR
jgi:hypothetical protein